MTELEKIAYHEAGHLVFGVVNFFGEPDYPSAISISIKPTHDSLGKMKGFAYYEGYTYEENPVMVGYPKYPTHNEIMENEEELKKMKKDAIQSIGGAMAEHLCCGMPILTFVNDDPKYSNDCWRYATILNSIHGYPENLPDDISDEEKSEAELKLCNDHWNFIIEEVKKKPQILAAIEFVKKQLMLRKHIDGELIRILVDGVKGILSVNPSPLLDIKFYIKKYYPIAYSSMWSN